MMMPEIQLQNNLQKTLCFLLICLGFCAGCYFLMYQTETPSLIKQVFSWIGLLLFGFFGVPSLLWQLLDRRIKIFISKQGIDLKLNYQKILPNQKPILEKSRLVAWSEIESIENKELAGQSLLLLYLKDETLLSIPTAQLKKSPNLLENIRAQLAHYQNV